MTTWLDTFNAALRALEDYMRAVRMQQQTFSMDEFNRLCNAVKSAWNEYPQLPPAIEP